MNTLTKKDIVKFNKTKQNDICFNEAYNEMQGYCSMKVFSICRHILILHYGICGDANGKKLTADIVKQYPCEVNYIG